MALAWGGGRTGDGEGVARADRDAEAAGLVDVGKCGNELGRSRHTLGAASVAESSGLVRSPHVELALVFTGKFVENKRKTVREPWTVGAHMWVGWHR